MLRQRCLVFLSVFLSCQEPDDRYSKCPLVGYEPKGSRVDSADECPDATCPLHCWGSGICDTESDEIRCEECRDLVDYMATDCVGCYLWIGDESGSDHGVGAFGLDCREYWK